MLSCGIILTLALVLYSTQGTVAQIQPNFEITKLEKCGTDKGPLQLHFINITNRNKNQYVNFDGETKIPIDDNVGVICKIEYAAHGQLFVPLVSFQDKNTCKTANQYLSEFWHDIQRASHMAVGVCPVAPGRYRAHNALLDFKKIPLQTVPFGTIKITVNLINNKNPSNKYFCILIEVQSRH